MWSVWSFFTTAVIAAALPSALGHNTHVCTMTTPGNSTDTCGKFVLWLGTYEHGQHLLTPGKAVVQLGQTIYPSSPFQFAGGAVTDFAMPSASTLGTIRATMTSSAFRAASPAAIQHAIVPGRSQVKCYSSAAILGDRVVTEITDANAYGGCDAATHSAGLGMTPQFWYFIELTADSSADLLVSVDGVDQTLAPVQTGSTGACTMSILNGMGENVIHNNHGIFPAAMLDVPSCGTPCTNALTAWPNAMNVTGCPANTASGTNCRINCAAGFSKTGGTVRCDNGAYTGSGQCSVGTSCPAIQARSVIPGLVGVTGVGCGVNTAQGAECLFNCVTGQFSMGTITCDPATNTWIPSANATCQPGNGTGTGDPERVPPPRASQTVPRPSRTLRRRSSTGRA
jgi:hypothetical protein